MRHIHSPLLEQHVEESMCSALLWFLLPPPLDAQLSLSLLHTRSSGHLDVELSVWIQVAADGFRVQAFRQIELPSELLPSVRAGAFIVLLLLLRPPADSQPPARLPDSQLLWGKALSVQGQAKELPLSLRLLGRQLHGHAGLERLRLLQDLVLKFVHQLLQERSDLWPQTAYRPVEVHDWTEGRLESMRAQQHLH